MLAAIVALGVAIWSLINTAPTAVTPPTPPTAQPTTPLTVPPTAPATTADAGPDPFPPIEAPQTRPGEGRGSLTVAPDATFEREGLVAEVRDAQAGLLLVINGSPYERNKDDVRLELSTRPEKSIGSDEMWAKAEGALEGALKLKEISYIHAEGYPAGEMKHGPIALLDARVPVVSIAVPGAVFDKVLSNAQEAKARDAQLIGVAPECPDAELFDVLLPVPAVDELLSPLLTVIPMQLLSYHIAAHRGLDVDQPRNLAKSVTVE